MHSRNCYKVTAWIFTPLIVLWFWSLAALVCGFMNYTHTYSTEPWQYFLMTMRFSICQGWASVSSQLLLFCLRHTCCDVFAQSRRSAPTRFNLVKNLIVLWRLTLTPSEKIKKTRQAVRENLRDNIETMVSMAGGELLDLSVLDPKFTLM